jgi:Flp pilus assembly protein TadG
MYESAGRGLFRARAPGRSPLPGGSRPGRRRRGLWHRLRRENGQSLVEFAIVLPVLLMLITGILQFGLLFHQYITLTDAVRAGARVLALDRGLNDPCDPAVAQTVNSAAGISLSPSQVTTTLRSPDTCGSGSYPSRTGGNEVQGDQASVTASQPFTLSLFGISIFNLNLSATASDAIE